MEDLVDEFNAAKRNYTAATEDRKKAFEQLKEKDEKSAREIEQQMAKIQRITDQINQLKCMDSRKYFRIEKSFYRIIRVTCGTCCVK